MPIHADLQELREEYTKLLKDALRDLYRAVEELEQKIYPNVPIPRPRVFVLADDTEWPDHDRRSLRELSAGNMVIGIYAAATWIAEACGWQPRKVLRALRRIQAATAWCRARAEGRRKMAQEILRQQERAVEVLEAEAAITALGRD